MMLTPFVMSNIRISMLTVASMTRQMQQFKEAVYGCMKTCCIQDIQPIRVGEEGTAASDQYYFTNIHMLDANDT